MAYHSLAEAAPSRWAPIETWCEPTRSWSQGKCSGPTDSLVASCHMVNLGPSLTQRSRMPRIGPTVGCLKLVLTGIDRWSECKVKLCPPFSPLQKWRWKAPKWAWLEDCLYALEFMSEYYPDVTPLCCALEVVQLLIKMSLALSELQSVGSFTQATKPCLLEQQMRISESQSTGIHSSGVPTGFSLKVAPRSAWLEAAAEWLKGNVNRAPELIH